MSSGKTPLSYTIHKNKLKLDERPKCETGNHQNPRREHRQQPVRHQPQQLLAYTSSEARETKAKKKKLWDFIRIKSFCTLNESTKLKGSLGKGPDICK